MTETRLLRVLNTSRRGLAQLDRNPGLCTLDHIQQLAQLLQVDPLVLARPILAEIARRGHVAHERLHTPHFAIRRVTPRERQLRGRRSSHRFTRRQLVPVPQLALSA